MWREHAPTAPEPRTAACRSGEPVTTCALVGMPIAAATSARTGPMSEPEGTSGGSRSGSIPLCPNRIGSYAVRERSRLSVNQAAVIDIGVAAASIEPHREVVHRLRGTSVPRPPVGRAASAACARSGRRHPGSGCHPSGAARWRGASGIPCTRPPKRRAECPAPARVAPHQALAHRCAIGINRHGARPLAGAGHPDHALARNRALRDAQPGCRQDRAPPCVSVLCRAPAQDVAAFVPRPHQAAGGRDIADLRAAAAEVNGQDQVLGHVTPSAAAPAACRACRP